jgi:hypothetical protein
VEYDSSLEDHMLWIIAVVVVIVGLGVLEWRSRNKPLAPGLQSHWGVHSAAHNGEGRAMSGGHDNP